MHHALEIQEILLNIFDICHSESLRTGMHTSDLVALAATCLTFKELALDALWRDLYDLSPLARCLPEACCRSSLGRKYSFTRPLTRTEWGVLRSYTSRIHCVHYGFMGKLDWESVKTFLNPPSTEPLFPNLRILHHASMDSMPLLRLPLPSLIDLSANSKNPGSFRDLIHPFASSSPNIRRFRLFAGRDPADAALCKFISSCICQWRNLQTVFCPLFALDELALVHLSHMHALKELVFMVGPTKPALDSPLVFSNLHILGLRSESLSLVSQLFILTLLPAVRELVVHIESSFEEHITSFLSSITDSNTGHTIEKLRLSQTTQPDDIRLPLSFEDLQPCMVFNNLRQIDLDVSCNMNLTDSQLLMLASAWPRLELLLLNQEWGWNSWCGISPGGLIRLLRACPSLNGVALSMDTRGYTEVPPSQVLANIGLKLAPKFSMVLIDSAIEPDSITAVTTFLCGVAACYGHFFVTACLSVMGSFGWEEYQPRWDGICRQVRTTHHPTAV